MVLGVAPLIANAHPGVANATAPSVLISLSAAGCHYARSPPHLGGSLTPARQRGASPILFPPPASIVDSSCPCRGVRGAWAGSEPGDLCYSSVEKVATT